MNWIIVGGAPLSRETHEFIRVCLGAIVVQVKKYWRFIDTYKMFCEIYFWLLIMLKFIFIPGL